MEKATKIGEETPPVTEVIEEASSTGKSTLDGFLSNLRKPKENVELPEHLTDIFTDEEIEDPYTEEEAQQAGVTDAVFSEYGDLATMYIGMFDSFIGGVGYMMTGNEANKYMKFAKSPPPDYYVRAASAVIAKYQAVMGPEALLLSAVVAIYHPSVIQITQDRKLNAEKKANESN